MKNHTENAPLQTESTSSKKTARTAGVLYFLFLAIGIFCFMYVPSKILVDGDSLATANNIMKSELLFRFGIISNLISEVIFIFLVLALYQLLKGVDEKYARLMLTLVIASVPVAFLVILNQIAPLILLSGADYLKVFGPDQLNALTMFFLNLYNYGIIIIEIFWGLWLFPFGYLVYKSGFIPKILGVLLIISCFALLIDCFTFLLIPNYYKIVSQFTMLPMSIGEISMILWLLIKGVNVQKNDNQIPVSS